MNDSFLSRIDFLASLPAEDFNRVCNMLEDVELPAGEVLFAEGDAGDRAYIIKDGLLEVVKISSGRQVLIAVRGPSEVIGEMALLDDYPRSATVRARTDVSMLAIPKDEFNSLLRSSAPAANAVLRTVLNRMQAMNATIQQSEKMAQLGTLVAGVAHEMNNPIAAVKSSAGQLEEAIRSTGKVYRELFDLKLTDAQWETLWSIEHEARERGATAPAIDPLARSDLEYDMEIWLDEHNIEDAWSLAPALVSLGLDPSHLSELLDDFEPEYHQKVLVWVCGIYSLYNLLVEIGEGTTRISEIVGALRSYTYLDQAPVQNVDIHAGLENTLIILRNKLKSGITIERDYAADLPHIEALGSELNQVWTNIIDNAVDALGGKGTIILRTRLAGDQVVVEIEDNGPGIPLEIQPRIFDPFFTTKPPGIGTGLGLNISYNIIVMRHQGDIRVDSEPGRTVFSVWLPVSGGVE